MQVFSNSQLQDDDYCGDGDKYIGGWASVISSTVWTT